MKIILIIVLILLFFIFLLLATFTWGRKMNKTENRTYPLRHSDINIFTSGTDLFRDLFTEIKEAKDHIHIIFYIVKDDQFGKDFLQLLRHKAENGVEVRLLTDWIGSFSLSREAVNLLKKSGVHFAYSYKPKIPFISIQRRNHRKITVIDGKIGYLGGYNIGKEYIGKDPKLSPWRDYHLKLTGECLHDLQLEFLADWKAATKEDYSEKLIYFPPTTLGTCLHKFVPTNGTGLEETFKSLIQQAKHHIFIGTPYFIPSKSLLQMLRQALADGIKLTIIVPEKADHPFVKEASYPYLRILRKEGASILQFHRGFYHSKIFLIDDQICDIGTANFDRRSLFLNYEINCLIYDQHCIKTIQKEIREDCSNSHPISEVTLFKSNFKRFIKEKIAILFSSFL